MCKKMSFLVSFVLVLSLAGSASGDLVAHWKLDESSGTTAVDATGNGHDGTIGGNPQWVTGHFDGALDFDGTDDNVNIVYSSELSLNEFTVSAWVNISVEPGVFGVFGTRAGGEFTFDLKVSDTFIHGDIGNGSAWIDTVIDIESTHTGTNGQGGDLAVGTWYMITYVIDNTNQQVRLYLDADLKRTITISGTPLLMQAGQSMRIGHTGYPGVEWMNGLIDDVRIYDNALTETEIGRIMLGEGNYEARDPDPAHLAVDVSIETNLTWTRGDGAKWDKVYFGTDPCD
ncbi:MAG: LamG domain-containing protein, partial [Planctomycetota bacterium]